MGYFVQSGGMFGTIEPESSVPFDKLLELREYAQPPYPGRTEIPVIDHGNQTFSEAVADILLALQLVYPQAYERTVQYLPKIEWAPNKFAGKVTVADSGGDFANDLSPHPLTPQYIQLSRLFRSILHETGHCLDQHLNDPDAHVGTYPMQPVEYRAEWYQVFTRQNYNRFAEERNERVRAAQREQGRRTQAEPETTPAVEVVSGSYRFDELLTAWRAVPGPRVINQFLQRAGLL